MCAHSGSHNSPLKRDHWDPFTKTLATVAGLTKTARQRTSQVLGEDSDKGPRRNSQMNLQGREDKTAMLLIHCRVVLRADSAVLDTAAGWPG